MPDLTILLVPTDPASPLLADGPCGARPPVLRSHRHKDGGECWDPKCHRTFVLRKHRDGLVLAYGGKPVPEGMQRAALCVTPPKDPNRNDYAYLVILPVIRREKGIGGWYLQWCGEYGQETTITHMQSYSFKRYGGDDTDVGGFVPRPAGITDRPLLDSWALATICATRLPGVRIIILDPTGQEVPCSPTPS